jgi:alpha-L-rhamnosidase
VWRAPSGRQLVDFGQNAAGVVGIRLDGPAGSNVRLTHGEVLTPAGELDATSFKSFQRPVWSQLDEVVLDGVPSWYQPSFTIHGFRYLEVDGLAATLTVDDVEMVVLSSQLSDAGTFACSDPRITQLWRNTWWSTRSNFTDTPTDCPTRERSGWTGDIQVFAPTATGLAECQAFLRRYLRNLALEQFPDGRVPIFIPMELSPRAGGLGRWLHGKVATSVGWGDAAVRLPWTMYRYYGDRIVLERQYPSMRAWVDHLERAARARGVRRWLSRRRVGHLERYVLDSGFHFGEWLRPGEKAPVEDFLHGASISTAYFASSAQLLADMAAVLGHDEDARRYRKLASNVRRAWQAAFIEDNGRIARDRQDDYVRALSFDLVPDELRSAAADRLVELVEAADDHLATGFLSTPMLLQVLVDTGHADVAFRLLLQDTPPSWLDQVQRGATTIWETWQGYDADGNAAESHNHYAFGAVAGWLREALVGIAPLEAGYRQIRIAPVIGGGLTWAEGSVETPFGSARSRWETDGVSGRLDVEIPTGVAANVHLPDGSEHQIGSGQRSFVWATTN